MILTAEEIYKKLTEDTKIIGQSGNITFSLGGLDIKINSKDTIGSLLQEWLSAWFKNNNIDFTTTPNSQDFPDFQLNKENLKTGLLEVKTFDYDKAPNFDVAAFMAYRRSLLAHPYRLDSDYLIFGYSMKGHQIEIKDVWLKKVWEITGPSTDWPLKCQVKQGEIFNIRPAKWFTRSTRDRGTKQPNFDSILKFITAFDLTQRQWSKTARDIDTSTWLTKVKRGYTEATGKELL